MNLITCLSFVFLAVQFCSCAPKTESKNPKDSEESCPTVQIITKIDGTNRDGNTPMPRLKAKIHYGHEITDIENILPDEHLGYLIDSNREIFKDIPLCVGVDKITGLEVKFTRVNGDRTTVNGSIKINYIKIKPLEGPDS